MKFDYIPQNTQKLFQTTKALTMKGKMFRVCYQKILYDLAELITSLS